MASEAEWSRKNETISGIQNELVAFAKENLKLYLSFLGDLNLDQAKAALTKTQKGKIWLEQIKPLLTLADCERLYYDMGYLHQKRPREDTNALRYEYLKIPADIRRVGDHLTKLSKKDGSGEAEFAAASQVLSQLCSLVNCRLAMIALYQGLTNRSAPPDFDSLHTETEQILSKYSPQLTHPWLAKLKHTMTNEVKILKSLWKTQGHLARYQFKDTMLWLTICREKLAEFIKKFLGIPKLQLVTSLKQLKKRIAPDERRPLPAFCQWCELFISALLCKASFYFYGLLNLRAQQIGSDLGEKMTSGLEVNHYAYIAKLLQRTQAHSFNLILDCTDKPSPAGGYAFVDQNKQPPVMQGIEAWPSVLTIPPGPPALRHWPNIISLIVEKKERLATGEMCVCVEDFPYTQAEALRMGVLGGAPSTPVARQSTTELSVSRPSVTSRSTRPSISKAAAAADPPQEAPAPDPETQVASVTYIISRVESRIYVVLIDCSWLPNHNKFDLGADLKAEKGEDGHARSGQGVLSESFDGYFHGKKTDDGVESKSEPPRTLSSSEPEDEEGDRPVRRLFWPGGGRAGVTVAPREIPRKPEEAHPETKSSEHARSLTDSSDHEEERRRFRPGNARSGVAITSSRLLDASRSKTAEEDDGPTKFPEISSTKPIQEQLAVLVCSPHINRKTHNAQKRQPNSQVSRLRMTAVFDQLRPKSTQKAR